MPALEHVKGLKIWALFPLPVLCIFFTSAQFQNEKKNTFTKSKFLCIKRLQFLNGPIDQY